ncbi:hypothetical protein [Pseudomonas rubra]|uniref:Uncharacterized protein n=1 Tax=Pseudomonas rubra TaxID=2942627 RepID=A0ABT5PBJ6_9PSED|nr:hypothetical protein [Pseudomonas rubra]MDD1015680.1 hypothetical protein [Pseudomonas rubra]MDD1040302.1 hypothetical protein [Pseudomonas rubra]MDD1153893.1 hypothetical protein [Pseudomonas rubra]
MQIVKTYEYAGNFGIVFHVSQIVVMPEDRARLRELHIGEAKGAHYQVNKMLVALYDRMQAGNRACEMKVAVSQSLSRQQADRLNSQRIDVIAAIGGYFGGATTLLGTPVFGSLVGSAAASLAEPRLPIYHSGDIIISIQASVSGGIGPQRSDSSMIIKNQG